MSSRIGDSMKKMFADYDQLRGKNVADLNIQFWDLIVISAGDEAQRAWFEKQLEQKEAMGDLPLGVPVLCISDPDGCRIGSGGATLNILKILDAKYNEELYKWRVLIINSGGYSKRLPSHSCSGKVFIPLPISPTRGGPYQMLDLKIATSLPFLPCMQPGVCIASSDDIIVFHMDQVVLPGERNGFTALAHPSSLELGTNHGVYVLQTTEEGCALLVERRECKEVLQKPSISTMKERGAIFKNSDGVEMVYSDSNFWFTSSISRKLLEFYKEVEPLEEELCMYSHLLTFLGSMENKYHFNQLRIKDQGEAGDLKLRFGSLADKVPLDVILLNQSKYYHLGTTKEYLDGMTAVEELREELNIQSRVCCRLLGNKDDISDKIEGVMLNSTIHAASQVHRNVVVEYSILKEKVKLHPETILSSVVVDRTLEIPGGFLYHTVPIREEGDERYVTVVFGVKDDIKSEMKGDCQNGKGKLSLWNGKLFPAAKTMEESFLLTIKLVKIFDLGEKMDVNLADYRFYSMEDLVRLKDCDAILSYRKHVTQLSSSAE